MSARPITATIYVGNLPFDATESEVQGLLSTIGQIKNFRLILDRETGKPKGFAFCEFHSKEDAESAYRNLNGTMFKSRQIRIDFADENISDRQAGYKPRGDRMDGGRPDREYPPGGGLPPRGPPAIGMAAAQQSAAQVTSLLGGAPSGDRRIQDMLNELLASKSRAELWDVMRHLKDLFSGDKAAAKEWFAQRPALAKVVFQAQVLLGMVKPLAPGPDFGPPPPGFAEGPISLRPGGPPAPHHAAAGGPLGLQALPPGAVPAPTGPMAQVVIVDPVTGQPQTVMVPADQLGTLGPVQAGPPVQPTIIQAGGPISLQQPEGLITLQQQPVQQVAVAAAAPAVIQQPVSVSAVQQQQPQQAMQMQVQQQQQPAPAAAAAPAGGMFAGQDPQQMQALLRQVMGMTDDQINALPEQFKQQVLYVKEQIRLGHVQLQ